MYCGKRFFIVLCIFVCLLSGCWQQQDTAEDKPVNQPVKGGVYRRAFADSYIVLDPALIKDSNSHEVCRRIYDGLVEFNQDGLPVPSIAKSWSISEDKLVYTFELRDDVYFHANSGGQPTVNKGRQLTADDVVYTFERLLKPIQGYQGAFFQLIKGARDYNAGKSDHISGIRKVASLSVKFELEKPFAPFVSLLGMCNAFIVPREDCEAPDADLSKRPVGSGPFSWAGKKGDTLVLQANQKHFRGRPWLDRIEFPIIQDEKERFAAFKRGDLMHVDVPDSEYENVKQNPQLAANLLEVSTWGTNYLGMNLSKPPFDNKYFRQAMNYAIDRKAIVSLVLNGRAKIANGVLPPGIPGYDPDFKGYSYDPDKAAELLEKAGYTKGKEIPEIVLQFNRDIIHTRTSEFVMANLSDIGIKCRVKEVEFDNHLSSIESGKAAFFRMGWSVDYPDPDSFLYTLFHSSNIDKGYNFTRIQEEKLDKLLDKARYETETRQRVKLYRQAEKLIVEHAPWVFMYFYTDHLLHQPEVKGIDLVAMGQPFIKYRKIWIADQKTKSQ
jgi:peptide/nickel transport system substrate-binding protein/oligopeptide transport system substrate-binding protein